MTMMGVAASTSAGLPSAVRRGDSAEPAKARRVALVTEEWIPPQSPLSEEMTMKSFLDAGAAEVEWAKTSVDGVQYTA
jgi:hypothetical protein